MRISDWSSDVCSSDLFYDTRLPADVCASAHLKNWLKREPQAQKTLTMAEADALRPGANADVESQFPDRLEIGDVVLALSYSHEPGEEHDGVTFHVPLAQRSEEHTSELQSLMRISYAVFCLKKKTTTQLIIH